MCTSLVSQSLSDMQLLPGNICDCAQKGLQPCRKAWPQLPAVAAHLTHLSACEPSMPHPRRLGNVVRVSRPPRSSLAHRRPLLSCSTPLKFGHPCASVSPPYRPHSGNCFPP